MYKVNLAKLNILCVEDDLVVADYISSLLDHSKYRVRKINDGKKALDFLLSNHQQIDIVLLDYHLPSLDGIQILQNLKHHKVTLPVVFLTVDETLETAVLAMKEGAIDYLPKSSFLKAELNLKVERAYQLFLDKKKTELYEEQISLLSMAVEQSPNSFIITDKTGNIEYVNHKFSQYTGYSFDEVKGQNPRILKTDGYPPQFFERLWKTISSGKIWKGEFSNRKKNGEIFYEKASIAPVLNKNGEVVSYIGINEDITELKKIEAELLKKNEKINHFFSVVVDLLCIIENSTGNFIRLNNAWENELGYTPGELVGKPFLSFVHHDDIDLTAQAFFSLEKTENVRKFINRFQCKDGSYRFIEWNVIRIEDGTSYGSARDITERIKSELTLKESETKFRTIFEMTNAGIFFSDKNGQIILANQALQSMIGFSFEDIYQMDFSHFTHLDDLKAENELLRELVNGRIKEYRLEKRYISNQNEIIWVDLAMVSIRDEAGAPLYYVGVIKDITARKQYEEYLKNANSVKDKFFSIISHDLRNQFSGIESLTEILLQKNNELDIETMKRYLKMLNNGGKSALNLLENLLEWSRLQINGMAHKPVECRLRLIVDDVLNSAYNQAVIKRIVLVNGVNSNFKIWADRNMITTVLRNLVSNAIKFTPFEGKVEIQSWTLNERDYISVKDSGIGMSQEKIDDLFKAETIRSSLGTENEKGSGLGLMLCNEFVSVHGGKIKVKSEPGKGAEFTIILPVLQSP